MWDLSCPDWEERLRKGHSLIPDLPLNESEADLGLAIFDQLCLPDVPGEPLMRDACGQWFREIVRVAFGSWFPERKLRLVRDILAMLPKGQSKTTYSAGLLLTAMLMNQRPRAEGLFVGPTQAISDTAYDKAVGMIDNSPDLKRRFRPREHIKTIEDLKNHSELKVKTFDVNILTGSILFIAMLDELHLLGRNPHTPKVLRQIRGGLEKTPEGLFIITTTQSDDIPAGAFRDELYSARKIRDGEFRGKPGRSMLPVLYEFPPDIARDKTKWSDPGNWPMVMPNLGKSVHLDSLVADWETEKAKNDHAIRIWASQHLNIEMGVGMRTDGWPGVEFWAQSEDETLSLDTMLERCEVIVIGVDGGGLDDLFGLTLLGRESTTKHWLSWSHAWCHRGVLQRRKSIASLLQQFADDKELTIVDDKLDDVTEIVEIVEQVSAAGLLACVAIDVEGPYGEFVVELGEIDVTEEGGQIVGIGQGYKLMGAIKTAERKLANGTFRHARSGLMNWACENVKIEPTATAIRATKANAGDAKIDPWCALMDAAIVMVKNPEAGRSVYDLLGAAEADDSTADTTLTPEQEAQIIADPMHPQWQAVMNRRNLALAALDRDED
jgi:phage terminase large subunit-like protein